MLRNPGTDETHEAHSVQPDGSTWRKGACGAGDVSASAEGLDMPNQDSTWIVDELGWAHDR